MRFIDFRETEETHHTWIDNNYKKRRKIRLIRFSNDHKTDQSSTQDDQSQSIEPGTNVGESPQNECEFDRVDQIFNQEQPAELQKSGIQFSRSYVSYFMHLLTCDSHILLQVLSIGLESS